ncbi:hypothetical protein SNE40_003615 [Patella caerulea]|uniref:Gustatory receptor n=1 Tax=Patella caerulea TaxID=87958 RepID=A0AAN8KA65_PATCE
MWCLIGAQKDMDQKNIAIYIGLLLSSIMALILILYGMIYVPSKLYLLITSADKLRSDPRFAGSYDNITKFTKVMVIIIMIVCFMLVLSQITVTPVFTNDYICFLSPAGAGSWYYWVNIVNIFPAAILFFGQKFIIILTIGVLCKIVTIEFNACNTEFRKMLDSDQTTEMVEMIRKRYFAITKFAEQVDDFLNPYVVLEIGVSSTCVCLYIHAIAYGHSSLIILLIWCGLLILATSEILLVLKSGVALNESAKLCLETTKYLDGRKMNRETISLVTLFIENMRSGDVGLTFMKLFILDKTTMVTVFGTMISYIIVIMQFKPS